MEKLLFCVFALLLGTSAFSQNLPVKIQVCDDVFEYQVSEDSNTEFSIAITKSSNDDFTFKLFSISSEPKLITEINSRSSVQNIEFEKLDKDKVYLVQVYGISKDCRFTIGGMEGIKFENK